MLEIGVLVFVSTALLLAIVIFKQPNLLIPAIVLGLPIEYFAMGDSVASGYGLDDDGTACRQSRLAYPWLVVG